MTRPKNRIDKTVAFQPIGIAVLTISDSRNEDNDTSGDFLAERISSAGHHLISRRIIRDDIAEIAAMVTIWAQDPEIDTIITTGGTGVTGRDVTPEALRQIMDKEIDGFGELFRLMSFDKIGTSAMQSRALAVLVGGTYVFALPGSPSACRDGWDELLVYQLDIRHRPCNFVEIMPRLSETMIRDDS